MESFIYTIHKQTNTQLYKRNLKWSQIGKTQKWVIQTTVIQGNLKQNEKNQWTKTNGKTRWTREKKINALKKKNGKHTIT